MIRLRDLWTDEVPTVWKNDIDRAESFEDLRGIVEDQWKPIAKDVLSLLDSLQESDWPEFKKGLELERSRKFAGEKWANRYMGIILPDVHIALFQALPHASMPLLLALDRLTELGVLERSGGFYVVPKHQEDPDALHDGIKDGWLDEDGNVNEPPIDEPEEL